jgi:transposase
MNLNERVDLVEVILRNPQLSDREIGFNRRCSHETVRAHRQRVHSAGLTLADLRQPDGSPIDGRALAQRLNLRPPPPESQQRPLPDWAEVVARMAQGEDGKDIWWAYKQKNPSGIGRAWFFKRLREYRNAPAARAVMVQKHLPGQRVQVDFAGDTPTYRDPESGKDVAVQLFVGVLAYSGLTFGCCVASQREADWLVAHRSMFAFFGGVTQEVVPDNLLAAVQTPGVEPVLNRQYGAFCTHYGVETLPARVRRPRDKGKVENGVQLMQDRLLQMLRGQQFFSLDELNQGVLAALPVINDALRSDRDGDSRRSIFEREERALLRPLPATPYRYAHFESLTTVPDTYHVSVEKRYYSVPHGLIGKKVQARVGLDTVEIFHEGRVVALHARRSKEGAFATLPEHMPDHHRAMLDSTPPTLQEWAATCGPQTAEVMRAILAGGHAKMGAARSLRNLLRSHSQEQLEVACGRAIQCHMKNLSGVRHALTGLLREEVNTRVGDAVHAVRAKPDGVRARRQTARTQHRRQADRGRS